MQGKVAKCIKIARGHRGWGEHGDGDAKLKMVYAAWFPKPLNNYRSAQNTTKLKQASHIVDLQ